MLTIKNSYSIVVQKLVNMPYKVVDSDYHAVACSDLAYNRNADEL